MGLRRGLGIGFLLGVLAALVGRIIASDPNGEQWREARDEADSAASGRESELRARHRTARAQGHLPADDD